MNITEIDINLEPSLIPFIQDILLMDAKINALITYIVDEDDMDNYRATVKHSLKDVVDAFNKKYPSFYINLQD